MRYLLLLSILSMLYAESYEAYVEMLRHDPSVMKRSHQSRALQAKAEQSATLSDPQLIFGVDNMPVENPSFNRYLPTAKIIGFNQKFTKARAESSDVNRLSAKKEDILAVYQHKILEVAFYKALSAHELEEKRLENLKEQQKLLKEIEEVLLSELESGKDVSAKISQIDERLLVLATQMTKSKTALHVKNNTLMRWVQKIPNITAPIKTLKPWSEEQLFPLNIAASQNSISHAKRKEADAKDGVDFSLQFLYKQREAGESFDGEDWVSLRGVMSLPVWGSTNEQRRAAIEMQSASQNEYAYQKNLWLERMKNYELEYLNIKEQIAIHKEHQKRIVKTYEAQERSFSSGRGTFTQALESKLRLLKNEIHIAEMQTQQFQMAAEQNSHIME